MFNGIKIFSSDKYWRAIFTDLGAIIADSPNVADVVFDDIDIKLPIYVPDLMVRVMQDGENRDIIQSVFGKNIDLPILARKIIITLYKNPNISMRELKKLIGMLPDITSHAVETAVYQLRKKYGHDIIQNNGGKYKIGRI